MSVVKTKRNSADYEFMSRGYTKFGGDRHLLGELRQELFLIARELIDVPRDSTWDSPDYLLNNIHKLVPRFDLNELRINIIRMLNSSERFDFKQAVFMLAKCELFSLVGNELAIQKRVNLSIQMPDDNSSILPLHADSWSGDSFFEVVVWVPLVDCYETKSMFLVQREDYEPDKVISASAENRKIYLKSLQTKYKHLSVDFGELLVFDQNLPHGNVVNRESTSRWSLNCRFKSLLSPYAEKKLGEFFEPLIVRPVTKLGLELRRLEAQ